MAAGKCLQKLLQTDAFAVAAELIAKGKTEDDINAAFGLLEVRNRFLKYLLYRDVRTLRGSVKGAQLRESFHVEDFLGCRSG